MAVTTDLTTLIDYETLTPSSYTLEFTGYTAGSKGAIDGDYPIQGSNHHSQECRTAALASIAVPVGTQSYITNGHIFMWGMFTAPAAVNTLALGGIVLCVGSSTSAWKGWYVGGNDFGRYPFGGWQCFVARDTFATDDGNGTPSTTQFTHIGIGVDIISAISKGAPIGCDVIRYGLGELRVNGTETFSSIEATANSSANRWGLFQQESGTYLWKGQLILGFTSAVTMTDSNVNISIEDTLKVNADFNRIEVLNTGSTITWTAVNITALGTQAPGAFEMIDGATLTFNSCTFTDMSTFIFNKGTGVCDVISTIFRRCTQVTAGGATITDCVFDAPAVAANVGAIIGSVADINKVTGCSFDRGTNGHAVELTGVGTLNWDNSYPTTGSYAYTGATGTTTTSVGNEAIYLKATSGLVTIECSSNATIPTVRTDGATVQINAPQPTLTITPSPALTNYEYRIYTVTARDSLAGATEVAGLEQTSLASFSYSAAYSAGVVYAVQIIPHNNDYEESITYYDSPQSNQDFTVNLTTDINN